MIKNYIIILLSFVVIALFGVVGQPDSTATSSPATSPTSTPTAEQTPTATAEPTLTPTPAPTKRLSFVGCRQHSVKYTVGVGYEVTLLCAGYEGDLNSLGKSEAKEKIGD